MAVHCSCNVLTDKILRGAVDEVLGRKPPAPHPLKEAFHNLGVDFTEEKSCKTCMRSVIGELKRLLREAATPRS